MKTFKQIFDEIKLGQKVMKREQDNDFIKRQLVNKDNLRKMMFKQK
jgi:hypothetical protein